MYGRGDIYIGVSPLGSSSINASISSALSKVYGECEIYIFIYNIISIVVVFAVGVSRRLAMHI